MAKQCYYDIHIHGPESDLQQVGDWLTSLQTLTKKGISYIAYEYTAGEAGSGYFWMSVHTTYDHERSRLSIDGFAPYNAIPKATYECSSARLSIAGETPFSPAVPFATMISQRFPVLRVILKRGSVEHVDADRWEFIGGNGQLIEFWHVVYFRKADFSLLDYEVRDGITRSHEERVRYLSEEYARQLTNGGFVRLAEDILRPLVREIYLEGLGFREMAEVLRTTALEEHGPVFLHEVWELLSQYSAMPPRNDATDDELREYLRQHPRAEELREVDDGGVNWETAFHRELEGVAWLNRNGF